MAEHASLNERLMAMRSAFDEAFARPPEEPVETRDLLVLSAGGERFALPLAGLAGVELTPPLTPLLSAQPALLGLSNCRGRIVPVFSLSQLLGRERTSCRMCVLVTVADGEWAAWGFEHLVELVRVPRDTIDDEPGTAKVLRTTAGVVPILDLEDLRRRVVTHHEET